MGVASWELLAGSCQEGQAHGTVARWELLAGSCQEGQARGTVARYDDDEASAAFKESQDTQGAPPVRRVRLPVPAQT